MLLGSVLTKALRDRGVSVLVGAVSLGLLLWATVAIYADIDTTFYYDLPPGALEAFGINPEVGGLSGIAYGAMYSFMGALTLAGIAISIGASSIAGEERDGTIGLLLANPRSRRHVLLAKIAALVLLTALGTAVLWLAGVLAPGIVGADSAGVQIGALTAHVGANALFWGMLAVAIGAWTGNRTAASAGAATTMVASYLATTLLPFFPAVEDAVEFVPWYWMSGSVPEVNGVDGPHLALLLGGAALLGVVAWVGVERRDLREKRGRRTLFDRLREHPLTRRWADQVAGRARVSSMTAKATSDTRGLLVVVSLILGLLSLYFAPMYTLLPASFTAALEDFPDALMGMIGQADMSTPTGWLQGELFSLTVPVGFAAVLVTVGARSLADEEAAGTMDLLLANPVSRWRVLAAKAAALVVDAVVLGAAVFVAVTAGVLLSGLDVSVANLAATTALATLLGLVLGATAFAIGAATGRARTAVVGSVAVILAAWFAWSFLPLAPELERWARLSPFEWYLGSDPLVDGMAWGDAALLAGTAAGLLAVSLPLFQRRDLRG